MTQPTWIADVDDLVAEVRRNPEGSWRGAEIALARTVPAATVEYLAVVGLAELATQTHRLDRDATVPCIGSVLAAGRYPDAFQPTDATKDVMRDAM